MSNSVYKYSLEIGCIFIFNDIKTVSLDAGYFNIAIVREIINNEKIPLLPYVRVKIKDKFFKIYDYVYDEYYDCYICLNNKVL